MKTQFKFSVFLVLIVAFITGTFTSATAQNTRTVDGIISVPNTVNELQMHSKTPLDFRVETHNKSEILYTVSVTREKWAKSDSLIKNELISVAESGGTQTITFTRPFTKNKQQRQNHKELSWIKALLKGDSSNRKVYSYFAETIITLTIPEDLHVSFSLDHGDVELRGLNADFNFSGSGTDLILSSIKGNLTIKNSYGDVEIADTKGNVEIDTRSSDIEIENLTGDLTIKTGYSDIELTGISGKINIDNRSGDIILSDVIGDIELMADYSDVEIKDAEGELTTNMRSGELIIQNLTGGLTHFGDYSDVELSTISGPGKISLEGRSAEIKLFEVSNSVQVVGDYLEISGDNLSGGFSSESKSTEIDLSEVSGEISLSGNNDIRLKKISADHITIDNSRDDAELSFEGFLPNTMNITTQSGDVTLDFSEIADLSATFDISVKDGNIITDNNSINQDEIREENDNQMIETVSGNGDSEITISVSNGTLRIR